MDICTLILMTSLPAAWIAVGGLLLILLLVMVVLYLLKAHEVTTLKRQCEDLSETMRMMRYEEANLSRMLHTVSRQAGEALPDTLTITEEALLADESTKQDEPTAPAANISDTAEVACEPEQEVSPEAKETAEEAIETSSLEPIEPSVEVVEEHEPSAAATEGVASIEEDGKTQEVVPREAAPASQPHKQAINERRPAIPNDLFAAWFAENESAIAEEEPLEENTNEEHIKVTTSPLNEAADILQATADSPIATEEIANSPIAALSAVPAPENESSISAEESSRPEEVSANIPTELSKEDERFCRKLERIVNTRLRNPNLNIDIIAAQFGIGRTNFYRKVRELMDISPNDYLRKCRMERAAELLCNSELPINDVCAQVGIPDAQYFSRVFKTYFGVSPSVYREQQNQ